MVSKFIESWQNILNTAEFDRYISSQVVIYRNEFKFSWEEEKKIFYGI